MPMLKIKKEIRSFLGKIQFINRFITKLKIVCEPIFKWLQNNQPIVWNKQCEIAFDKIKEYLIDPPALKPLRPDGHFILYLAIKENAIGVSIDMFQGHSCMLTLHFYPCDNKIFI